MERRVTLLIATAIERDAQGFFGHFGILARSYLWDWGKVALEWGSSMGRSLMFALAECEQRCGRIACHLFKCCGAPRGGCVHLWVLLGPLCCSAPSRSEGKSRGGLSPVAKVAAVVVLVAACLLVYANLEYFKTDVPVPSVISP